jgi:peptide/nickel transport system permease protein
MGLRTYIIRRLLFIIPTILGVCLLIFAVVQILPVERRVMLYIEDVKMIGAKQQMIEAYGLNQPAYVQFVKWMGELLRGNLGWSEVANSAVLPAILNRVPATAEIVIFCAPIIILVGITLGTISAVHRDKPLDHATRTLSIMGTSLPSFWIGIVLLAVFYGGLGWFPPFRFGNEVLLYITAPGTPWRQYTGLMTVDALLNGQLWIFLDALRHLVLPVVVLTLIQTALIVRVMRSSMLESLGKGYITAAMAKGLTQKEVINKHARRNALIPVVTISGLLIAGMLTGLIITETVFDFPGIGSFAAQAAIRLDIAAVLGYALLSAIVFVVANLIVDVMYAYIDPRIRLG